ncbi:hypothetical protein N7G274_002806 [Stereocaulon virgatum]|uniref:Uncharacterized protein n=1 Tax=Stereocaulon virgatum TaxID=373712 RepID=A0ABR4AJP3_9LECA
MPDWRDASPNYISYASSPHKSEAPHAYLSLDAVVNLNYEVGEFGRSINETPPRSRFDRRRRMRRVVEVESSSSSSSSSSSASSSSLGEDERGEGWKPRGGPEADEPVRETNEIPESVENKSIGVAGDDDTAGGREMNADDEAGSMVEASVHETIFEAVGDAVDDSDIVDQGPSAKGKEEKGTRAGEDAIMMRAPGKRVSQGFVG